MLTCPYCGKPAQLTTGEYIYPHRHDLKELRFWVCWPCEAHVGCHREGARVGTVVSDGTLPLGRLANAALRKAKSRAHAAFDPIWKTGRMRRRQAYSWLAKELGIAVEDCRIGMFDEHQCALTEIACYRFGTEGISSK